MLGVARDDRHLRWPPLTKISVVVVVRENDLAVVIAIRNDRSWQVVGKARGLGLLPFFFLQKRSLVYIFGKPLGVITFRRGRVPLLCAICPPFFADLSPFRG